MTSSKIGSQLGIDDKASDLLTKHIAYDLLGPVIHRWLLALEQYHAYLDDGNTSFLFCARAGVRIKELYEIHSRGRKSTLTAPSMLWSSRVAIAKGVFDNQIARERATSAIAKEYHHRPLADLVSGLLRHHPDRLQNIDLSDAGLGALGFNFPGWIKASGPVQKVLKKYLAECTQAFKSYLDTLVGGNRRIVLIDSGWQGSTQSLLNTAFPDKEWKGLYFGRILAEGHDPRIVHDIIGLIFENNEYRSDVPESAFVRHRHIIESLLEPNAPSIEEIPAEPFSKSAGKLIELCQTEKVDAVKDALFIHVRQYMLDHCSDPLSEIFAAHERAMPQLARVIVFPTRDEAVALLTKDRSEDFGKSGLVPVLLTGAPKIGQSTEERIASSLWPEGQAAIEYDAYAAHEYQMRLAGLSSSSSYFDHRVSVGKEAAKQPGLPRFDKPRVAIITRTKNRPLLLKRAAVSVAKQTFTDFVWVVVNDGGDSEIVKNIIEEAQIDRRRIVLVSHKQSLGMEAASNAGINATDSEFVVIHDDDDSWTENFLEKTVAFLSASGKRYAGVITHSTYVSEEIIDNRVIEHHKTPYQDWVRNVQLAEMACGNFFPPIAFLFKRSIWQTVGGFNENLPVLGDWYFNLEFLLRADIGVITEPLANYHHRDKGNSRTGLYANSVIGGISKHEEFLAVARNEFLRKYSNNAAAAASLLLGHSLGDIRHRLTSMGANGFVPHAQQNHFDKLDFRWAVAQTNRVLRQKRIRSLLKGLPTSVDTGASWGELGYIVARLPAAITAPEDFDEIAYLSLNEDVAKAVRNGVQKNAYMHYLVHGRVEGRPRPCKESS